MIGKIQRVRLREVWKHEALDFTTWLEENFQILNDALDLTIESVEREQSAGDFSVDLVGEDSSGNVVVIENQLERSDHDHLGKLITYVTAMDAKLGIWIVREPRPEHVKAISWLNECGAAAFYLVKVEAIKIDESLPAPLLTLITGPSEEAIKAGNVKKELAEQHVARKKFWTELLERAKAETALHAHISPSHSNWVGTSAGLPPGINLVYIVRRHDARVELYIDAGKDSGESNQLVFDQLIEKKELIESEFGEPLEWEALEGKQACRIKKTIPTAGWQDDEKWSQVHEEMIRNMIHLDRALRPQLRHIVINKPVAS